MPELNIITTVSEPEQSPPTTASSINIKKPKRILHFSDGTMEEYSSDDEVDGVKSETKDNQIDVVNKNSFHLFI